MLKYWFHYLNVCYCTMSVDPEGQGSARSTRISLINEGMGSGLAKCCLMSLYPIIFCRGSQEVVTALPVLYNSRVEG